MLKPASGLCNLRCKYCFYADETSKREVKNHGIMSEETLYHVIQKVLANVSGMCTIAFQGGEPTLAGLDFFKKAVVFSKELNVNHCRIHFAIQTNGTLLDDAWCAFFKENSFLVGVSLDGIKETHDANRIDAEGKGTYGKVIAGIRLLEKHGVDFNILTVLTSANCRSFRKIYQNYKNNGWDYQQYIPCLDPLGEERGKYPWSLTPERYELYLKTAFDCWYQDAMAGNKKYHRYFDNLLLMMDGQPPEACGMAGHCTMQYVVEADGSVYPCDFYMLDNYLLGNFNKDSIEYMDRRREEIQFITQSIRVDDQCKKCRWYHLCRGGCRRDRDYFESGISKNYFCPAHQSFFEYAYPKFQILYRSMKAGKLR